MPVDELDALRKFKEFVHKRLDDAGIPTHPEGEHSKHGCRIGDRLDIALKRESGDVWLPMDSAPKDGTPFINFFWVTIAHKDRMTKRLHAQILRRAFATPMDKEGYWMGEFASVPVPTGFWAKLPITDIEDQEGA